VNEPSVVFRAGEPDSHEAKSDHPSTQATPLVRYDAARRALAEAHCVDEVKDIRDKAAAMQLYARQAKDGELIAMATEIRRRAERRLGEIMAEERKAGRLAKPPNPKRRVAKRPDDPPTLAKRGISKSLADRARKAAAIPEGEFEAHVAQTVEGAVTSMEGKAARQAEKRERRRQRELELAAKITALPEKKYGVIYADPPWRFEPYSAKTGMDRAADNHYPTMDVEAIKVLAAIPAADDCVLFLWATVPVLPAALEVIDAWGFTYKSALFWVKDKEGTGYWTRNRVELLLIGTRGNVPAPAPGEQPPQVIEAPRDRHSEKPAAFAEIIEKLYPNVPKIELFARAPRPGWDVWGNEVPAPGRAGDDADAQESAEACKSVYAAIDEAGMTDDPRKEGIPVFLQTQNQGES
jgi:N6-adenosine-specific RNA methylase IME4